MEGMLAVVDDIPEGTVIYVSDVDNVTLATPVLIADYDENNAQPPGYRYFLQAELVRDAIEAWSEWRDGISPSMSDKLRAAVYYADHDAYLPVE